MNLINTKEAAEILDVSSRTIVRWIHDGKLPGVKINPRAFAIAKDAVLKLAQERELANKEDLNKIGDANDVGRFSNAKPDDQNGAALGRSDILHLRL